MAVVITTNTLLQDGRNTESRLVKVTLTGGAGGEGMVPFDTDNNWPHGRVLWAEVVGVVNEDDANDDPDIAVEAIVQETLGVLSYKVTEGVIDYLHVQVGNPTPGTTPTRTFKLHLGHTWSASK